MAKATGNFGGGNAALALNVARDEVDAVYVAKLHKHARKKDAWEREQERKARKKSQVTLPKFSWDK